LLSSYIVRLLPQYSRFPDRRQPGPCRWTDCATSGRNVALAFGRNLGILIIQTPNPLTSQTLADTFRQVITRTLREANVLIDGLPVYDVQFQSKR
jgi:hypothetical protein